MEKKLVALAVVFSLVSAVSAKAGFVTVRDTPNPGTGTLANTITNDVVINDQGDGIVSMQMRVTFTAGGMVEQGSSSTPPDQDIINALPNRAFDSFVSAGAYTAQEDNQPVILGRSTRFGGPGGNFALVSSTEYDLRWEPPAGVIPTNETNFLAARLTWNNNSRGLFSFQVSFNNGTEWIASIPFPVPEPTSCSLISLAVLGFVGTLRLPGASRFVRRSTQFPQNAVKHP